MSAHIGVKDFYALLRELNPHLPAPEHVCGHLEVKAGLDEISTVTIEVMVELPAKITLEEVEIPEFKPFNTEGWKIPPPACEVQ